MHMIGINVFKGKSASRWVFTIASPYVLAAT